MFFPIVHRPGFTHTHTHIHTPARAHLLRPILDSVQNRLAKSSFVHEVWDSLVIPVCKQWPTEWPFKTASRSCKRSVYTYVFHLSRITITFYRDAWHHESANIDGRQDDFVRIYFSKKKKIVRIFIGEGKKKFLFALINFINRIYQYDTLWKYRELSWREFSL